MKIRQRIIGLTMSGILLIGSLAGCGSQKIDLNEAKDTVTLKLSWWGTDVRQEYTAECMKLFQKKYPYIKVKLEYGEFTGFEQRMDVKMAAHTEADVMQLNYSWLGKYSPDGSGLYDLTKLGEELDLSSFTEDQLAYCKSNGVLNSLPIAFNSKICFYNQSIYDRYGVSLPKTWDDLYSAAKKMSKDQVYPIDIESGALNYVCVAYEEQKTGKQFLSQDGKLEFGTEEIQDMIEFYLDLVDNQVVEYFRDRNDDEVKAGKSAGAVLWITNGEKMDSAIQGAGNGNLVPGDFLTMSGAKRFGWYAKPATIYAVSSHTEHPKEAAMLLDFLVNSKEMATKQGIEKGVPASSKAKEALKKNELLTGLQADATTLMEGTKVNILSQKFEMAGMDVIFQDAVDSVYYKVDSSEKAAKKAYQQMTDLLK